MQREDLIWPITVNLLFHCLNCPHARLEPCAFCLCSLMVSLRMAAALCLGFTVCFCCCCCCCALWFLAAQGDHIHCERRAVKQTPTNSHSGAKDNVFVFLEDRNNDFTVHIRGLCRTVLSRLAARQTKFLHQLCFRKCLNGLEIFT